MKTYFLMNIVLFLGTMLGTVTAQTIQGKVTTSEGKPIDGATVVLQTLDSTFVDATITETDGSFLLSQEPEHYRLIFQHILYNTTEHEGTGGNVGIITLTSKDYALNEVVVKGERPLVKVESGRLTYDMPQLTANKLVTNAYEAVKQLPGVIEQNDVLTLAGSSSVSLILNGVPSSMTYEQLISLLKSMPASRVERAEVMYSAPPQLHVRGAAINIVLKGYKPEESSLQGEINGTYTQLKEAGGEGGITLVYTTPKWETDFMYNVHSRYSRQSMDFFARHTVEDQVYDVSLYDDGQGRDLAHLIRVGGTYKFDEKNRLSLSYTTNFTPKGTNHLTAWGNLTDSYNNHRSNGQMHNAALGYVSGFGLKAGADYTYYSSKDTQDFTDKTPTGTENAFVSTSNQRIDRWKVYADQSHSFANAWTLNYGASFTYVNDRNTQLYDRADMVDSNTKSRIDEYTYSVYTGFSKQLNEQWNLSTSVAGEYYQMMDYKRWAVYPTFSLNYMPSVSHIFQLEFSSDKTYPDYWTLSGTIGYLNGYQQSIGNAFLKPYADYSATLVYILKQKYIFQLSYSYQPDYFTQMVYLDTNELKSIYNFQNWDYSRNFTLTAVVPFKVGEWWDSNLMLTLLLKHDKASNYFDAPFDNQQWSGIGNWRNTFTISKQPNIKLEVSTFGQTKAIQGSYYIQPIGVIDAALRYTFARNKAMIQVKGNDLFNGYNHFDIKVRNGLQHLDMNVANYRRSLMVSFSYKFGGFKKKESKGIDTSRFGL